MKAPETTCLARMWMSDFAPWDVELPLIPGSNGGDGTPYLCQIPMMIEGHRFLVRLVRGDRSDGHWNFYEKRRDRMVGVH